METESKTSDRDTSQLSDPLSDLDSLSDSDSPVQQTEWLATTRERRSTAGNRMKSILANEEPDSDLELLFAEDENDQGFFDVDENGSDVQMDSSSADEDDNNADADELEGEKELERQARAKRAAQRKRKAQEAIPAKFRKRVRIDSTTTASTAPPPRPKKKSERTSWLPSAADLPTRASSRKTTRISKEQLHLQMAEREARRLKQLAQMEKKAARLEAMKKPPMTQEQRLAEAAIVEKRNSKSLNRWEEAEKQREQERKAKLVALNQRTLRGPFITFWSGQGQWDDLDLRSLRPYVTEVEEKPKKKKKDKADKGGARARSKNKDSDRAMDGQDKDGVLAELRQSEDVNSKTTMKLAQPGSDDVVPTGETKLSVISEADETNEYDCTKENQSAKAVEFSNSIQSGNTLVLSGKAPNAEGGLSSEEQSAITPGGKDDGKPKKELKDTSTNATKSTDIVVEQPTGITAQSGLSRQDEARPSGVLAAPVLAPPPGMDVNGSSAAEAPKSNILAPPTISLSEPSQASQSQPAVSAETTSHMKITTEAETADPNSQPLVCETAAPTSKDVSPMDSEAPAPRPEPPRDINATRNGIIYQNFNEFALRDKNIQTLVLFGRKMSKLASESKPCPVSVHQTHLQQEEIFLLPP